MCPIFLVVEVHKHCGWPCEPEQLSHCQRCWEEIRWSAEGRASWSEYTWRRIWTDSGRTSDGVRRSPSFTISVYYYYNHRRFVVVILSVSHGACCRCVVWFVVVARSLQSWSQLLLLLLLLFYVLCSSVVRSNHLHVVNIVLLSLFSSFI